MSISATSFFGQTSFLDVLASAASTAAQMRSRIQIDLINGQIQKQLKAKIAELQNAPDTVVTGTLQTQITALQKHASAASTIGSKFGANANVLSDLQNQLAAMQTAAAAGDAAGFDAALAAAGIDVGDLGIVTPTAPFQPDRIDALKANGLAIGDSASYDLSTPQGQAAAAADVQAAQTLIGEIFQATTSNQVLAGSITTALTTHINTLVSHLRDLQQTGQLETTTVLAAHAAGAEPVASHRACAWQHAASGHGPDAGDEPAATLYEPLWRAAERRRRDLSQRNGTATRAGGAVAADVMR